MRKILGRLHIFILLMVALWQFSTPLIAQAHSVGDASSTATPAVQADTSSRDETKPEPTQYTFIAANGDALSYIVRRSVQLYSQSHNISVTTAAALYIETNITQTLGNARLEIGQQVEVPFALIVQYITTSQSLSAEQLAAWAEYVPLVSFDVSSVNPLDESTGETPVPAPTDDSNNTSTDSGTQQPPASPQPETPTIPDTDKPAEEADQHEGKKSSTKPWLILAVAVGALAAVYFISSNAYGKKNS